MAFQLVFGSLQLRLYSSLSCLEVRTSYFGKSSMWKRRGEEKTLGAQLEALEVIEVAAQITLLSLEKLSKCTIVPALRIMFLV